MRKCRKTLSQPNRIFTDQGVEGDYGSCVDRCHPPLGHTTASDEEASVSTRGKGRSANTDGPNLNFLIYKHPFQRPLERVFYAPHSQRPTTDAM
jgi:hypothetical protein